MYRAHERRLELGVARHGEGHGRLHIILLREGQMSDYKGAV
jgi:hypothetical protein